MWRKCFSFLYGRKAPKYHLLILTKVLVRAFFETHCLLLWAFLNYFLNTYTPESILWGISKSCSLTTICRWATGKLVPASWVIVEGDNIVHSCWDKQWVSLSTKSQHEPMPSETCNLKVMCFLSKRLIRRNCSKERIINWQMSVWSFSDYLRGQMLLDWLLVGDLGKQHLGKSSMGCAPKLEPSGSKNPLNAGQQETSHAKGKQKEEI